MNSHARLFHWIAPVYSLFFRSQTRSYQRLLEKHGRSLPSDGTALDIGCGPGSLSHALTKQGYTVTGVDSAPAMIRYARKMNSGGRYIIADARQLAFSDRSFDLVTAAFVAHGMDSQGRLDLYREAGRLARELVLIHDYNQRRNPVVDFVETLEGGNYFSFLRTGVEEMQEVFGNVIVLPVGPRTNWYLCYRNKKSLA